MLTIRRSLDAMRPRGLDFTFDFSTFVALPPREMLVSDFSISDKVAPGVIAAMLRETLRTQVVAGFTLRRDIPELDKSAAIVAAHEWIRTADIEGAIASLPSNSLDSAKL